MNGNTTYVVCVAIVVAALFGTVKGCQDYDIKIKCIDAKNSSPVCETFRDK